MKFLILCFFLIKLCYFLGAISTEDTSYTNIEDGGLLEELCETLILTIVMVLWKGVVGSDDEAWTVSLIFF